MIEKSFLNKIIENPYIIAKLNFNELILVFREAVKLFKEETMILELKKENPQDKVFVIGDLHGDLKSLIRLLEIIRLENPKYVIFLGDIVDRGLYQLECLILVLALKIKDSKKYYLLKGNHETLEVNQNYGFFQDFLNRFEDPKKFNQILAIYNALPYCALVNESILCLHGGIPEDFNAINRLRGIKTIEINLIYENTAKSLLQIIWNDPNPNLKGFTESFRGRDIKFFGEDVFTDFMQENKLDYLIRAHERFPEGYKWFFNERLLSIFSSVNYRGTLTPIPASYAIIRNKTVTPMIIS
ncbi:MAG TPA: metallophosphoesterase [Candidatus Nanopelagicaceae bacterium]|jgi:serine/threonine-protein phosphatase 4 catalytic subunit|nr:metallophosphoesterase [Candidatus Nanopelagicaceae bacterium]